MSWLPPIGIPAPAWGALGNPIDLARPDPPSPWTTNVVDNYYVEQVATGPTSLVPGRWYIIASVGTTDWTVCGADSNLVNLYFIANSTPGTGDGIAYPANQNEGFPGYPRHVIPGTLAEGSKVFLHGTYAGNHASGILHHVGTEAEPIWVTAYDPESRPQCTKSWATGTDASYLIISDVDWDWSAEKGNIEIGAGTDHLCIRNFSTTGTGIIDPEHEDYGSLDDQYFASPMVIQSSTSLTVNPTEQLVFHNYNMTRGGNWQFQATVEVPEPDRDAHGFSIAFPVKDIWMVDGEISYMSGCAVQVGAGSITETLDADGALRCYVGRNTVHHISQSAIWSKRSNDCVFSQNTCHTMRRDCPSSNNSGGIGGQYGPRNLWIIYNTVHNCQDGIQLAGGVDPATGISNTAVYIVGNVLYDIHDESLFPDRPPEDWRVNTSNPTGGSAILLLDYGGDRRIINNTLYDYDGGIIGSGIGADYHIEGNIFASHNTSVAYADFHCDAPGTLVIANNIFTGTPWVKTGDDTFDTFDGVETAFGATNSNTAPTFESAGGGDFRLASGSAGIDAIATEPDIYDLWETMYPTRPSIRRDRSGGERPWTGDEETGEAGGNWDIGAYEYGAAIPPPPPPAATFSPARHITPSTPGDP